MTKFSFRLVGIIFLIVACNNKPEKQRAQGKNSDTLVNTSNGQKLTGKWVHHSPKRNTVIEIKDTAHVLIYALNNGNQSTDTLFSTMGFFDDTTIWIKIATARFDYRIRSDTLIEFDKMGVQAKYIKLK